MDIQTSTPPDLVVARLADAQHGVVSRPQLLAAGLSTTEIGRRLRGGRLVQLHRGVYAPGHRRLGTEGFWLAAVLACGPRSALSHRDAATLHGLDVWSGGPIDVSTSRRRKSDGRLRVFARRRLDDADVTVLRAIPVTTVARTLVDLAELVSRERLASALTAAERTSALDLEAVLAARERAWGRHGAGDANLRAVLTEHAERGAQLTREALERRLRRLVRVHALGSPLLNAPVAGYEVDAYWPEAKLIVETDGWVWHRDRAAFGRDREKTNTLQLAGFTVLRFTHDAVVHRPEQVAAAIRSALGR